jgi:two-component system phosphate regulon sensor histidine kinase PhoR
VQAWRAELKRHFLVLAAVSLAGFATGELTLAWLLLFVSYAVFNFYQLLRLTKWLAKDHSSNKSAPPESFGLWGGIFDGIYRLQKQERRASAYLENIVNKAQESSAALEMAVIMIDRQNNLDWWNQASESLLGLRYPQDRRQPVTNLIRDPRFSEYFSGNAYDEPLKLNAPGDSGRVLEFQIALFGENERLMIARDITQLHRLELMRTDFVGNVSHELGTPITVIKGYLEAIMDNMQDLDDKWQKPIRQMHQQSSRMENIVKDLLLLSSLETKTRPRPQDSFSLLQLLSEIRNDTQQIFAKKSHDFRLDCDEKLQFLGERGELYSAISNLVTNAAKYTPAEGTIMVSAQYSEVGLEIVIRDNGIGIEPQHLPRLTERFYRVDVSRSSETGGTGLGLAIVKHIVGRHDGELNIDSEVGKGSRFVCHFPPSRVRLEAPATASLERTAPASTA